MRIRCREPIAFGVDRPSSEQPWFPFHDRVDKSRALPIVCASGRGSLRIRRLIALILSKELIVLLDGKTLIVTGGNSGIGEAIVLAAAAEGANIVIDYVANPDETTTLIDKVEAAGGHAVGIDADVSKPGDIHKMIEAAGHRRSVGSTSSSITRGWRRAPRFSTRTRSSTTT